MGNPLQLQPLSCTIQTIQIALISWKVFIIWFFWLIAKNYFKKPLYPILAACIKWYSSDDARVGLDAQLLPLLPFLSSSHSFLSQQPPPFWTDRAATRSGPSRGFWGGAQTRIIYKSCSAIETVVFLLSNAWNGNACYREHKITPSDTLALLFPCRFYTVPLCVCVGVYYSHKGKLRVALKLENLAKLDGTQVITRASWNVWESLFYPLMVAKQFIF